MSDHTCICGAAVSQYPNPNEAANYSYSGHFALGDYNSGKSSLTAHHMRFTHCSAYGSYSKILCALNSRGAPVNEDERRKGQFVAQRNKSDTHTDKGLLWTSKANSLASSSATAKKKICFLCSLTKKRVKESPFRRKPSQR